MWRAVLGHLRALARLVEGDALARMRAEIAAIVTPAMQRLGWEVRPGDDDRTRQLRGLLINVLGSNAADPETIARAREVFANLDGADADVQAAAINVVASNGSVDDFDDFIARADATANPQEQLRYLYALGEFPHADLALRAAALSMSESIRAQNGPFVMARALRNRDHGPAVWALLRDEWAQAMARFSPSLIPRLIEGTTWLVDDAVSDDVLTFVDAHPVAAGGRTIAQHMERLRLHRAAVGRERDRFSAALLEAH